MKSQTGVIILNYFSHPDTLRLCGELSAYPGLRLLVVDNSCDQAEAEKLKRGVPAEQLLFSPKNRGYAGGNNLGIRKLLSDPGGDRTDLIALLNPDISVRENIFPALRELFESNSRLAAAGPRLCIREQEMTIYSDGGQFKKTDYLHPQHVNGGKSVMDAETGITDGSEPEIDYINGSFLMIRTAALRNVGEFNEKFFLYFEEAEWCMRARQKGWSLKVRTDSTAWQRISPKESTYNYYFFRSWFLFLHLYDKPGLRPLFIQQLKKIKWILQDPEMPVKKRIRVAARRFGGIMRGYFNI